MTRRGMLQSGAGLAVGSLLADAETAAGKPEAARSSVYQALGVKHVINATGTVTMLGGSLMPPEVVAAWADAAKHFVNLLELQDRVGERIAKLIGVEAAMVTTGAAGALLLGTAAAVTRGNPRLIKRLPDTEGARNEVLLQKAHHSCYDNQLTDVGVRLIEVETAADVKRAIGAKTALMFFMNFAEADGKIGRAEWVELARRHKVLALRQVSDALVEEPGRAETLLPVLAVAMRSVRAPEARAGLAALVHAADLRPDILPLVERYLPEVQLIGEVEACS